ncbi:MAG: hypothetical protein M3365_02660 [Gemmatimonadota bacterium]|nr:hypothetical protein [Gemmatimonadota bacterium]
MMIAFVIAFGALVLASASSAQLPAYNVPDDPAFVFLNASPKKVANPGTLPALGIALAEGVDIDGRVNAGLAVSFLPSNFVRYTLATESYRNGRPAFWFYNTQISVGTVRKSGDTASTDLAFGFRTILAGPEPYSSRDFRNAMARVLDRCLTAAHGVDTSLVVLERRTGVRAAPVRDSARPERTLPRSEGTPLGTDTVRLWNVGPNVIDREVALECGSRGKSRAIKAWMKDHWNDATLAISAATGTRFEKSAVGRRASLGRSLWLHGALPIRWTRGTADESERINVGQIAAQLHYVRTPGGVGGIDDSSWEGGVRALAGKSNVNGFVEVIRNLKKSGAREDRSSWASGVEYMIAESLWLSAGVGERYSRLIDRNRDFVFLNLKWALARDARLTR